MNLSDILNGYAPYKSISENLDRTPVSVSGVTESAQPHLIYSLTKENDSAALVITYTDAEARTMCAELSFYCDNAVVFPSKEYIFYNIDTSARQNENERLSVISSLMNRKMIVVASLDALLEYTIPKNVFEKHIISFKVGDVYDLEELSKRFVEMGYSREDIAEGPGQFAIRGGILDIFSPNYENPLRIEFFDNEVDSVRDFDSYSQRSLDRLDTAEVIPVYEAVVSNDDRKRMAAELKRRLQAQKRKKNPDEYAIETLEGDIERINERGYFPSVDKYASLLYGYIPSIADYFTDEDMVFIVDPKRISERGKTFEWEKGEAVSELKLKGVISGAKDEFYRDYQKMAAELSQKRLIALEVLTHTRNDFKFRRLESFVTKTTVSFHGKIEYMYEDVRKWHEDGYTVAILVSTRARGENLEGVLNERGLGAKFLKDGQDFEKGSISIIRGNLNKGFEYPEIKFVLVSDREIFETKKSRRKRQVENADRIKSYNDINPGDYVVHAAHGIGQYMGTEKMTVNNTVKDYLKIQYRGADVLYIPIDQLNMLYKYAGSSDKQMKLNRLGGQEWNKAKARVKKATDELAKDLIKLYAQRAQEKGFAFSADTPWQRDFEDRFPYQETEDQLRSIEEVKADMEMTKPMDRLLCGDVGFGKTEVALRAAFKAVNDSKQVAYLCPTTVLAMQQYETFLKRMEDFPIKVEMLSRFRSRQAQSRILRQLKSGEIDIIIGTHRLLSKDLKFKDLGLLVVDEEQRFGVAHKERLKELKTNVDVLTMTATPIPRTLHMAMTSVRDMSVLTQPPLNRYPVQTYVLEFNVPVILDAIRNELSRGGQVYYLFNRVQGIYAKAAWLQEQFPDKNVVVGHGKMNEEQMEEIMYDMVNGDTDILVCTTIIETGLDIPNANTIIIEDADRMGLAQLYQLRGRVGRSNRAAYAYLTYKPDTVLNDTATKRLKAIKEFTEFGSGFKIAMRDLEIRGAGNILGAQQHGHMDTVGYDMYCKILKESINEAKGIVDTSDMDVTIDLNINAYLPDSYITNHNQRIDMYKKIAAIETENDKMEIEDELIDRYGDYPGVVQNIIDAAALKYPARDSGIFEIKQNGAVVLLKFIPEALNASLIFAIDEKYPKRIKVLSGSEPSISFKLTEEDKNVIKIVSELLTFIYNYKNGDDKS